MARRGRKTARQIAASRRNVRVAQAASARKRKGVRITPRRQRQIRNVAIGAAVVGAGLYANDRRKNVYLYHNTDKRNVSAIRKSGYLKGVQRGSYSHKNFHEGVGEVFVSKDLNQTKMFGNAIVRVRMDRKAFKAAASRDYNMRKIAPLAYKIDESTLRAGTKSVRVFPARPMQRMQYKLAFPDGTKESYGTRPTLLRRTAVARTARSRR